MRFIPRTLHGLLDYVVGGLLLGAPWLFGFAHVEAARTVALIVGGGVLLYSLLTAYEWGLAEVIPFTVHLALDVAGGFLLAASPWVFWFSDDVIAPHLVVGIFSIFAGLCTRLAPTPRPIITSR